MRPFRVRQTFSLVLASTTHSTRPTPQLLATRDAMVNTSSQSSSNTNHVKTLCAVAVVASGLAYANFYPEKSDDRSDVDRSKDGHIDQIRSNGPDKNFVRREGARPSQWNMRVLHKKPMKCPLLTDKEITNITTLINDLVDLPYVTDEEEQMIFEFYVRRITYLVWEEIPPVYINLVRSTEKEGISTEQGNMLETRLITLINEKKARMACMPFMDEINEARIVRCVVAVIIQSMVNGNTFATLCDPREQTGRNLVLHVFIKGFASGFEDQESRDRFVATIVGLFDFGVPGLPLVIKYFGSQFIEILSSVIEIGINRAAHEFLHGERLTDPMDTSGLGLEDTPDIQTGYAELSEELKLKSSHSIEMSDSSDLQFSRVLKRELAVLMMRELAFLPQSLHKHLEWIAKMKAVACLKMVGQVIGQDEVQKRRLARLDFTMNILREKRKYKPAVKLRLTKEIIKMKQLRRKCQKTLILRLDIIRTQQVIKNSKPMDESQDDPWAIESSDVSERNEDEVILRMAKSVDVEAVM